MLKRRIGLQKDVSLIFKGVPVSADQSVATPRHVPILSPPTHQKHACPRPTVPEEQVVPQRAVVGSPPEQPASVQREPQGEARPAPAVAKVSAPKATRAAVTIKAPRATKGGMQQSLRQIKSKLFAPKLGRSSTRQKAMLVLVPALAVVFVLVLTQLVGSPSRSLAKGKEKALTSTFADSAGEIDWKIPAPYPATLRDPMQASPLVTAQAKPQVPETVQPETDKLIVRSILHSQQLPSAVIGTQIVYEGDVVLGATIVRIGRDRVEFEKDGKTWTQQVER